MNAPTSTRRARLLVVLPYVPFPVDRGTYQRVHHLVLELADRFTVDLACLRESSEGGRSMEPYAGRVRRAVDLPFTHPPWPRLGPGRLLHPLPATVRRWWDEGVRAGLRRFVAGQEYDLVHALDLVLWPYLQDLFPDHPRRVLDRSRVDWLFQEEELGRLRLGWRERLLRRENLRKIARLERRAARGVAAMIVCGPDDRAFLARRLGRADHVHVLPNGYSPEYFDAARWPRRPAARPTLLFCGALDYSPNVEGVEWFRRAVWPAVRAAVPDAEWIIVGKSPDARADPWRTTPGVRVVGSVPDVRPYYQEAWFQVVPLRIGGGTRLKIVESLALHCPVLSTPLGAQGLDLADGEDLLLAGEDDGPGFAAAAVRLCREAALRDRLAARGAATVARLYPWPRLGAALAAILEGLLP